MNMLEPDRNQERPDPRAVDAMWRALTISPIPTTAPAVEQLLIALRQTHVNGGAIFQRFALSPHPVLHWFGSRNSLEEIAFSEWFLGSKSVRAALPELQAGGGNSVQPDFEWTSSFTLDGEIARVVYCGGAYERFRGTAREAKNLGAHFCDSVFGDRFAEVEVYRSCKPWSTWFYDIAWDITWLVFDKREISISLLCVTDTD